jgi:hypothetical protein
MERPMRLRTIAVSLFSLFACGATSANAQTFGSQVCIDFEGGFKTFIGVLDLPNCQASSGTSSTSSNTLEYADSQTLATLLSDGTIQNVFRSAQWNAAGSVQQVSQGDFTSITLGAFAESNAYADAVNGIAQNGTPASNLESIAQTSYFDRITIGSAALATGTATTLSGLVNLKTQLTAVTTAGVLPQYPCAVASSLASLFFFVNNATTVTINKSMCGPNGELLSGTSVTQVPFTIDTTVGASVNLSMLLAVTAQAFAQGYQTDAVADASHTASFTLNADDSLVDYTTASGNRYVTVPGFSFHGFFAPIDNDPALNSVKAGAAIPVKFSLGGDFGLNIFATGFPASQSVACNSLAPLATVEETVAAGQSGLTYDVTLDEYTYVWKTNKSWANTCRQLMIQLVDGSVHAVSFKFAR